MIEVTLGSETYELNSALVCYLVFSAQTPHYGSADGVPFYFTNSKSSIIDLLGWDVADYYTLNIGFGKEAVLKKSAVVTINNGVYTMPDGSEFKAV
jgi:hypothetical protein